MSSIYQPSNLRFSVTFELATMMLLTSRISVSGRRCCRTLTLPEGRSCCSGRWGSSTDRLAVWGRFVCWSLVAKRQWKFVTRIMAKLQCSQGFGVCPRHLRTFMIMNKGVQSSFLENEIRDLSNNWSMKQKFKHQATVKTIRLKNTSI